jgi:hypothetical protein
VSEKWVREEQFWALGLSRKRRKGQAAKKLAEALRTEAVTYKLLVIREVKMEIPVQMFGVEAELLVQPEPGSSGQISEMRKARQEKCLRHRLQKRQFRRLGFSMEAEGHCCAAGRTMH